MAKESGRKLMYVPYWFLYILVALLWMLKVAQAPPSILNYHRVCESLPSFLFFRAHKSSSIRGW